MEKQEVGEKLVRMVSEKNIYATLALSMPRKLKPQGNLGCALGFQPFECLLSSNGACKIFAKYPIFNPRDFESPK